ncbi:MAG: tetratricopeptide repeat protein [Gemmatimonadaceae bacterium]|nr:tetratricopeptide repeat protein [Gemmatimonadaceae bacterium]
MYTDGDRVTIDLPRGATLFQKSCALGDGRGCMLWGYALQMGRGTAANPAAGLAAYEQGCRKSNALGCHNAGIMYQTGTGTPRDEQKALELYTEACNRRLGMGCRNLGVLHAGAPRNCVRIACRWWSPSRRGAISGTWIAATSTHGMSNRGMGTTRDTDKARLLYAKACDGGYELACKNARPWTGRRRRNTGTSRCHRNRWIHGLQRVHARDAEVLLHLPVAALASRANELALVYVAMLREKRYAAASMYAPAGSPPPQLTVDCRHNRTRAQALDITNRLAAVPRASA